MRRDALVSIERTATYAICDLPSKLAATDCKAVGIQIDTSKANFASFYVKHSSKVTQNGKGTSKLVNHAQIYIGATDLTLTLIEVFCLNCSTSISYKISIENSITYYSYTFSVMLYI